MKKTLFVLITLIVFCCKTETKKEEPKANLKHSSESPNFLKNKEIMSNKESG